MKMDWRNVFVVSSVFIIEATGDSEMDTGHVTVIGLNDVAMAAYDDDWDAQSCSYDSNEIISAINDLDDSGGYCDDDGDGDGDSICIDQKSVFQFPESDFDSVMGEQKQNLIGGGDARTVKLMNEMEDRLFWETCLQVGYP